MCDIRAMADDFTALEPDEERNRRGKRRTETELTTSAATTGVDKRLVLRLVFGVVVLVLFLTFAIQNSEPVDVSLVAWDFEMRLFILMVLSAAVGAVVWEIARALDRRRKRRA